MHSSPDVRASIRSQASDATAAFGTAPRLDAASARLDGFRAGREEGFEAGRDEGRATAEAAVADAVAALGAAAVDFRSREDFARDAVESLAVELAVELAEVIIGVQLAEMEPGTDVIGRALSLRRGLEPIRVRMHPADAAAVSDDPHPDVTIVADSTIPRGGAAAEVADDLTDISIDAAIARVREVLS